MRIFKISQDVNNDYDTYDSAVVVAENGEEAKRIHPSSDDEKTYYDEEKKEFWRDTETGAYKYEETFGTWTDDITKIKVEYIGEAKGMKKGVVLASYNAG